MITSIEEEKRDLFFSLKLRKLACDISLDNIIDHLLDKDMNVTYKLRGGIQVLLNQRSLDITIPTGKLANRIGTHLIELGEVPDIRALGNSSPRSGLMMLEQNLNDYADILTPVEVRYHIDNHVHFDGADREWGGQYFLRGALARFFKQINSLPIEELAKEPIDTKKYAEKLDYTKYSSLKDKINAILDNHLEDD